MLPAILSFLTSETEGLLREKGARAELVEANCSFVTLFGLTSLEAPNESTGAVERDRWGHGWLLM